MPEKRTVEVQPIAQRIADEPDYFKRMGLVTLEMFPLFDPDQLLDNGLIPNETYQQLQASMISKAVERAAKETGADPAQIASKERTQEQQRELLKACASIQVERLNAYTNSNYLQAQLYLRDLICGSERPEDGEFSPYFLITSAVQYYFATHTDKRPSQQYDLTDADRDELTAIYKKLAAFQEASPDITDRQSLLLAFIAKENPQEQDEIKAELKAQTQLMHGDMFSFMISKAAKKQTVIAKAGASGQAVKVDQHGTIINATISDQDGNPVILDEIDLQLQDVIGDMGRVNGYPLYITPDQIWQYWKDADGSHGGKRDDIEQLKTRIIRMLSEKSELDFRMQIERHKNLKRQQDFDYDNPDHAISKGSLITGTFKQIKTSAGDVVEGFIIYEPPMYYSYSHAIGQLATASTKLLHPPKPKKGIPSARQNADLRRLLLRSLETMKNYRDTTGKIIQTLSLDTIIENLYPDPAEQLSRQSQRTLISNILDILNEWKADENTPITDVDYLDKRYKNKGFKITLKHSAASLKVAQRKADK